MNLPQRGPSARLDTVLDQRELNEAVQLLKVGAEKFLACTAKLRVGSLDGPIVGVMGVIRMAENEPRVAMILDAVKELVVAFGGEVVQVDPENS